MSLWVNWAGAAAAVGVNSGCKLEFFYGNGTSMVVGSVLVSPTFNSWARLDSNIRGTGLHAETIGVTCRVDFPWSGTLLFDDVTLVR